MIDTTSETSFLQEALQFARNSRTILFCGAGFSADCINFNGDNLPVAKELLEILNGDLVDKNDGNVHDDLSAAAQDYIDRIGEHFLLQKLADIFSVKETSNSVEDILNFPWDTIYTTNYDNAIEKALEKRGVKPNVINITQSMDESRPDKIEVIHLHGYHERWEVGNFLKSCVLSHRSYLEIATNNKWVSSRLREDYRNSDYIFFVGFSNNDFYLTENLYNSSRKKSNVFFINNKKSKTDVSLNMRQKELGNPFAIGHESFGEIISDINSQEALPATLNNLRAFKKIDTSEFDITKKSGIQDQKSFLLMGKEEISLQYADIVNEEIRYRFCRHQVDDFIEHLDNPNAVCFIVGEMCTGKSIFMKELMLILKNKDFDVFYLKDKLTEAIKEIDKIVKQSQNPVIFIDDCFTVTFIEDLIAKINESNIKIVLSSRPLARDSARDIKKSIHESRPYLEKSITKLHATEVQELIKVIDRVGGWGQRSYSRAGKERFIKDECGGILPRVLVRLFNSNQIIDKFEASLEKALETNPNIKEFVILAMYLRSCGIDMISENLLSEALQASTNIPISESASEPESELERWISLSPGTDKIETIKSIDARDALENFFSDGEITGIVIDAICNIADLRNNMYLQYKGELLSAYRQLFRYTNLKQVIGDSNIIKDFFDELSSFSFCYNSVLFWLQYSIANRDMRDLPIAEEYLDTAYGLARRYKIDNINDMQFVQLEDQRAALLLDKAMAINVQNLQDSSARLQYFKDAILILKRLLNNVQSPHPYNKITIDIVEYFEANQNMPKEHKEIYIALLDGLKNIAQKDIDDDREDSFLQKAKRRANRNIDKIIEQLKK